MEKPVSTNKTSTLGSIHKKMSAGAGEFPYSVILSYMVQCCEIRNLKKGPKRYLKNWGSYRTMYCLLQGGEMAWILMDFFPIQCFWGKTRPKSYSCYGMLFGEIDFRNIGRAFHGGL